MEYRIFTENDRLAASVALMAFLREMDGKTRKSKTLLPVVEHALEGGVTFDELFNRQNWLRASAAVEGLSPDDYIALMISRSIDCRSIKEEEGWCDDMDNMSLIARCFHDFYMHICPKGGTWSTDNARLNLENAIKIYSLQALMSEKSIRNAMGEDENAPELTCFNYVLGVIKHTVEVEDTLSEPQYMLKNRDEEYQILEEEQDTEGQEEEKEDEDEQADVAKKLRTEPEPEEDDLSIYDQMDEDGFWGEDADTFVSLTNPREMKRGAIMSIIYNYMMDELNELIALVPDVTTLSDFVEKLTDGNIDAANETTKAREIHQIMNGELLPAFINCINMQGFEMTEELAMTHDPLMEKWDFRDERTRKLHKLKRLIYNHGEEDQDLLNCIPDIEKLYATE